MKKYMLNKNDFLKQLEQQITFIERSSKEFDIGNEDEAIRIAVSIRILLHDTEKSKSLLQHLLVKSKIDYWNSSSDFNSENLVSHLGLTCNSMSSSPSGDKVKYLPAFSGPNKNRGDWQSFHWWWHKQPVIVDNKKNKFHRKDLVLGAANKDGGAHVDSELDETYAALTKFNSPGWLKIKNGVESPFDNNILLPSIRQIAFELMKTLEIKLDREKYIHDFK